MIKLKFKPSVKKKFIHSVCKAEVRVGEIDSRS